MSMGRFELKVSADDDQVAYLRLPTHSGKTTRMSKSIRLIDLIGKYDGPEVVVDFDPNGMLVGIEIIG